MTDCLRRNILGVMGLCFGLTWSAVSGLGEGTSEGSEDVRPVLAGNDAERESDVLASAAREMERQLVADQDAGGFWLTSFTPSNRFAEPNLEMNTFVTSMMVSILEPIADAKGLAGCLANARRHLGEQIEPSGLVRYYGRTKSPWFGGTITPDSDDTALVWSVVTDVKLSLLPGVLATLREYRDREGLYRTWLAPDQEFQGINRGTVPNPVDVGIQLDLLIFLAKFDPPGARLLFDALKEAIGDESIWVYYKETPLIPLLRAADLSQLGYNLSLSGHQSRAAVAGQSGWNQLCVLLGSRFDGDAAGGPASTARSVLRSLAANGFSGICRNPPLLYHNDTTASVRRYYWSQDIGYALWLRLYSKCLSQATVHSHAGH
jgi:hypothetical protein